MLATGLSAHRHHREDSTKDSFKLNFLLVEDWLLLECFLLQKTKINFYHAKQKVPLALERASSAKGFIYPKLVLAQVLAGESNNNKKKTPCDN